MSSFWKPDSRSAAQDAFQDDAGENGFVSQAAFFSPAHNRPLAQQRMLLPIYKHKKQILYAAEQYSVVVIVGETGSGKSTQIPQYLVEAGGWADNDFSVVVTQPRRLAAMTLAQRVAQEVNTQVGETVGYTVRFDDQSSPYTKIKYVTDGMLLREATLSDPLLSNYSVVMVDEAHERNLNSDAVLGLLKKIRRKRKNNLRIIVCSATIDAPAFLNFFLNSKTESVGPGSSNQTHSRWEPSTSSLYQSAELDEPYNRGTIISVDGRQFSVDILYLEQPAPDYIRQTVHTVFQICHTERKGGDILCFFPSGENIDSAIRLAEEELEQAHNESLRLLLDFLPLYGTLPFHMQARVFQPPSSSDRQKKQLRRVIFATNIAETSVT